MAWTGEWTDEMKERVGGYLAEKLSASQIGERMGVSRNAIIGIVRRNKHLQAIGFARVSGQKTLEPKTVKGRRKKPTRWTRQKPATVHVIFERPSHPATGDLHTVGVPMMELRPNQCRFAVNDAAKGELHLFCAAPTHRLSYCEHHWAIRNGHGTSSERFAQYGVAA